MALNKFQRSSETDPFPGSTSERAAGNGFLMRLAPVPQCPPGFSFENDTNACVCSASNTNNRCFQMPNCSKNSALITHGFWVGYMHILVLHL